MKTDSFQLEIEEKAKYTVIFVTGKIDSADYQALLNQCSSLAEKNNIIFDLSKLTYISSTGIGALLKLMVLSQQKDHQIIFCNVQTAIQNVLKITRLETIFHITTSLEKAASILNRR